VPGAGNAPRRCDGAQPIPQSNPPGSPHGDVRRPSVRPWIRAAWLSEGDSGMLAWTSMVRREPPEPMRALMGAHASRFAVGHRMIEADRATDRALATSATRVGIAPGFVSRIN
jgi:hypothetical protein